MRRRGHDRCRGSSVLSVGESPCAAIAASRTDREKSTRCVLKKPAEASSSSGTAVVRACRKQFTTNDDIFLLKDVIARNPFGDPTLWDAVVIALNHAAKKRFPLCAAKDRLALFLNLFKTGDNINLRKQVHHLFFFHIIFIFASSFNICASLVGKSPTIGGAANGARSLLHSFLIVRVLQA